MNEQVSIMVVDDEPFIRRSLSFVLKQEGFQVEIAEDGKEAWEKLLNGIRPQIMFIDVMMPRLSGFELCKLIKSYVRFNDIYLILLTARWQDSDLRKAKSLGCDEYITKPFSPSFILQRVYKIIKDQEGVFYE